MKKMIKSSILSFKEETKKLVTEISQFLSIDNQFNKLTKYVELIEKENKIHNLTGFTGESLWEEGIYDSIFPLWFFLKDQIKDNKNLLLIDIGSGVGFPSVPFSIVTDIQVLAIDSRKKRCEFLELVKNELNLSNLEIIFKKSQNVLNIKGDFITARAVGSLENLLKISIHLLKDKGQLIFFKGPKAQTEIYNVNTTIKFKVINITSLSHKETKLIININD